MTSFGSDNHAGVHPEVLEAIVEANVGSAAAYGADPWSTRFDDLVRRRFGGAARAFPVFNGTGANVLALRALTHPWEAVVCAADAHVNVDESTGPEAVGLKLLPVRSRAGKLDVADIEPLLADIGDPHRPQPRVVTVSQTSETGQLHTLSELRALADWCHAHALLLHIDGARIANAAAALGCEVEEVACIADALTLGATKNGALGAEAVVFPHGHAADAFPFLRKRGLHLASKQRFVAAQLVAMYDGDLWRRNADHANAMAARLGAALAAGGVELAYPVAANHVFARLPRPVIDDLHAQGFVFYVWDEPASVVRLMTAFDTPANAVDAFAAAVVTANASAGPSEAR